MKLRHYYMISRHGAAALTTFLHISYKLAIISLSNI